MSLTAAIEKLSVDSVANIRMWRELEATDGQRIPAHRNNIAAESSFGKLLFSNFAESSSSTVHLLEHSKILLLKT